MTSKTKQKRPKRKSKTSWGAEAKQTFKNIDPWVLLSIVFLNAIGLMMVYSVTSVLMYNNDYDNPFHYVIRQALGIGLGLFGMGLILCIPYRLLKPLGTLAILANPVILAVTLVIGTGPGVKSWIKLGPFSFQPAELVKIGMILAVAAFATSCQTYHYKLSFVQMWKVLMARHWSWPKKLRRYLLGPWGVLAYLGANLILIMKQPDLGSGLIFLGIGILLVLSSGIHWRTIGQICFILVIGFTLVWTVKDHVLEPHQLVRFEIMDDPFSHDQGYQNVQGYVAISNGGLEGVGLGNSIQKFGYMIEPHNDFMATVVSEEMGFYTILMMVAVYLGLGLRMVTVGFRGKDAFGSLVCMGCGYAWLIQVIINLGGVSGTIPLTGVTLPFVSYGGTSVMTTFLLLGVYLKAQSGLLEINRAKKLANM